MILHIETATTNCSVSIAQEGLVVSFKEYADVNYSHAEQLHLFISETLAAAAIEFSDLTAIAVSKGPGSYTGLRIGVSAAKGLCYALGIPLIAIPTLKSLASQLSLKAGEIAIPMLDARRMEVYMTVFDHELNELTPTQALIIEENSLEAYCAAYEKVYIIGSGAEKVMTVCTHQNLVGLTTALPSAKEMAALSFNSYKAGLFEDVAYFEPYYLKDFMAPLPKKKAY